MSSKFRSLYVNRKKYPHRKPVPQPEAVQVSLLDQPTDTPATRRDTKPKPAPEPIPAALYVSNGLIFGLFNGGQESNPVPIQWTRLVPVRKVDPA